jgi:hypothetical protein
MTSPSQSSRINRLDNIRRTVQAVKFLIMILLLWLIHRKENLIWIKQLQRRDISYCLLTCWQSQHISQFVSIKNLPVFHFGTCSAWTRRTRSSEAHCFQSKNSNHYILLMLFNIDHLIGLGTKVSNYLPCIILNIMFHALMGRFQLEFI